VVNSLYAKTGKVIIICFVFPDIAVYLSLTVVCTINILIEIVFKDYNQVINIRYLYIYNCRQLSRSMCRSWY